MASTTVSISAAPANAAENGLLGYTLTRTGDTTTALTVNLLASASGQNAATPGIDVAVPLIVTFAANETSKTLSFPAYLDNMLEPAETFTFDIQTSSRYDIGTGSASFTINNTPVPTVAIEAVTATAAEGLPLSYMITRTGDLSAALIVNVSAAGVGGSPASGGTDFGGQFTIAFAAGEASRTIPISTFLDTSAESAEGLRVSVAPQPNYAVDPAKSSADFTITENTAPVASIVAVSPSILEGYNGSVSASFTITLDHAVGYSVNVNFATANGSATTGEDFGGQVQSVFFAAGQTSQTITIPISGDIKPETDESFTVNLTGATSTGGGPVPTISPTAGSATQTIINDDVMPVISVIAPDRRAFESNANDQIFFIFSRTGDLANGLTVPVTYTPAATDGAIVNVDYGAFNSAGTPPNSGAAPTSVFFQPGSARAFLFLGAINDTAVENTEFFTVAVGSGPGFVASSTAGSAVALISDDDGPQGTVSPSTVGITGVTTTAAEDGLLSFKITRTGDLTSAVNVSVGTTTGTTVTTGGAASDVIIPFIVRLDPNQSERTFSIAARTDLLTEGDETLVLAITNSASAYSIDPAAAQATFTITDRPPPTVSIVGGTTTAAEGLPLTYTITRTGGDLTQGLQVDLAPSGAAAAGTDYFAPLSVLFAPGQTARTLTINTNLDGAAEASETFALTIQSRPNYVIDAGASSASFTITENTAPTVTIAPGSQSVSEGANGTTNVSFTIALDHAVGYGVSVNYQATAGSATAGEDFSGGFPQTVFVPQGQTGVTVTVPVFGDFKPEAAETFTVALTGATAFGTGNPAPTVVTTPTTVTIANDDPIPAVSIVGLDGTTVEGQNGAFLLTRTGGDLAIGLQVNLNVATNPSNGAAPGQDFTLDGANFGGGGQPTFSTASAFFAPGSAYAFIRFGAVLDSIAEGGGSGVEGFTLSLASPTAGSSLYTVSGSAGSAQGFIYDAAVGPAPAAPTLAIAAASADKPEGSAGSTDYTFTVTRSGDTSGAASANYAVSGAAVSPTDFVGNVLPTGVVSFAAGQSSQTITIGVIGDTAVESDEAFTVTLSNPSAGVSITTAAAAGTIRNDDGAPPAPTLAIAATSADKAEGQSGSTAYTFTVTRGGDTTVAASANYAVGGAAVTAADFTGGVLPTGTVSFAVGETSKDITVNVAGDTVVESDEAFTVTLSTASSGATITTATATGTIRNDDSAPLQISVADATVVEGTGPGTTAMRFAVQLSAGVGYSVSVTYATSQGSASSLSDYTETSGTLVIPAFATSAFIDVPVTRDGVFEPNEAFTLTLSNPTGGFTLGDGSATGTIVDDESSLSIAPTSADQAEGQSGAIAYTFTVTRTGDTTGAASASYAVGGSAITGADFVGGALPTGAVTFAAGESSADITVNVAGDTAVEPDEVFTVTLSNPSSGATIANATATGVIRNDDATLSIAATSADKAEGNSGATDYTFTVTYTGSAGASVSYSVGGQAVNGADFVGGVFPSGMVTFAPGETSKPITVSVVGDTEVEFDENFTVVLSNPSSGATVTTDFATGTIRNDDSSSSGKTFSISPTFSRNEGDSGTTEFQFIVNVTGLDQSEDPSVNYAVSGPDVNGADFVGGVLPSGTVTFSLNGPPSQGIIRIRVAGDTLNEPFEAFTVTLSNPSTGYMITNASASLTIENDDTPTFSIVATSADKAEGDAGATAFTFTVSRTGDSSQAGSVSYAIDSFSGLTGADFVGGALPSGTVSFAAGETAKVITINVLGDAAVEPDEDFVVSLSNPTNGAAIATASAFGTIRNDDAGLSIAATSADKREGNSGATDYTFTVSRTGDLGAAASASYVVSGAGVTAADFVGGVLPSGPVSFAAGESAKTITVSVVGDAAVEADEAFTVTLSNPSTGVTITAPAATGTIRNDDATLAITATSADKAEGNGGATAYTFTVTRSGDMSVPASASYAVGGSTVTAADFVGGVLPSGTISFAAGENVQTVTVSVAGDAAVEPDEAFTVTLSNPSAGATIATATATGTIRNDDATLSIAATSADKAEGNGGLANSYTFTVTRTGDTTVAASAAYAVGGAAVTGADFIGGALPSGTVSFAAGQTTQAITILVAGDAAVEPDEAFTVTLSNPSTGVAITTASATGTIRNDDVASSGSVSISDVTIGEGNAGVKTATFTVSRTGGTGEFSVGYATANGTATTADGDYVAASGTLSFAANELSKTVAVTIRGDGRAEGTEGFSVVLSGATNGAVIADGSGAGAITNDDQPSNDFNGDRFGDILFQNASGQAAVWTTNGLSFTGGGFVGGNVGPTWNLISSGDFNRDGRSDFLWQNDNGQAAVWAVNGFTFVAGGDIGGNVGPTWNVIDAGDFNGDGVSDILWQNDSGQAAVWMTNNLAFASGGSAGGNPGTSWTVKAAGDFDGDGKSDILWQNDDGQAAVWLMDGATFVAGGSAGGNPGPSWNVIDAGDFNGDGRADILWQNDDGQAAVWLMDGTTFVDGGLVGGNPGTSWHVQRAEDMNADGRADIVWRHDDGSVAVWTMNGTAFVAGAIIGSSPGTDWDVI